MRSSTTRSLSTNGKLLFFFFQQSVQRQIIQTATSMAVWDSKIILVCSLVVVNHHTAHTRPPQPPNPTPSEWNQATEQNLLPSIEPLPQNMAVLWKSTNTTLLWYPQTNPPPQTHTQLPRHRLEHFETIVYTVPIVKFTYPSIQQIKPKWKEHFSENARMDVL